MTSTVLDVTVMLLCVSASVVALGGVGGEPFDSANGAPDVERTADRLTTETATVTYDVAGSDDRRTVHATLAELLVMATGNEEAERENNEDPNGFTASALDVVSDAFGPRTRIDVRMDRHARDEGETEKRNGRSSDRASPDTGETREADAGTAETAGTELPRGATVTIGTEPPRGATVTTAVATAPVPDAASTEADRARFVVRVW